MRWTDLKWFECRSLLVSNYTKQRAMGNGSTERQCTSAAHDKHIIAIQQQQQQRAWFDFAGSCLCIQFQWWTRPIVISATQNIVNYYLMTWRNNETPHRNKLLDKHNFKFQVIYNHFLVCHFRNIKYWCWNYRVSSRLNNKECIILKIKSLIQYRKIDGVTFLLLLLLSRLLILLFTY